MNETDTQKLDEILEQIEMMKMIVDAIDQRLNDTQGTMELQHSEIYARIDAIYEAVKPLAAKVVDA